MPAIVAHHHFAVTALKQSPSYVIASAKDSFLSFRWGAQGPDILFYDSLLRDSKITNLGKSIHSEKIGPFFSSLCRYAHEVKSPVLNAHLLGFACHYVLDRMAHPLVQYMVQNRLDPLYDLEESALHTLCESDLDAIVIENFISGAQEQYQAYKLLEPGKAIGGALGELYKHAAWEIFGLTMPASKLMHSMKNMRTAHSFFHDQTGRRYHELVTLEEKLFKKKGLYSSYVRPLQSGQDDVANLSHKVWEDGERLRTESLFDIMEDATPVAARLMEHVYDACHKGQVLPASLFVQNYYGASL